jgi:hypothetical protein
MIQDKVINEFVDYLFDTPPYKTQFSKNNRDGLKNVIKHLLESLYKEIPEDIINYLEVNASKYFLDLLYREAGISDYFIQRVPESLKVRVSSGISLYRDSKRCLITFFKPSLLFLEN